MGQAISLVSPALPDRMSFNGSFLNENCNVVALSFYSVCVPWCVWVSDDESDKSSQTDNSSGQQLIYIQNNFSK
jgi:hypothetical protein